jgi:branched-chain amino acid transport system substrate-binding protein
VRPIVKIGLIAPFEGLYRESGYVALEGMRQAIVECAPPGMDVLPLALDDGGDPTQAQRAAQKLLVDPTVASVVGPLLLESVPAVANIITPATGIPWFAPPLLGHDGKFGAGGKNEWLQAQIELVANDSKADRVLLLGLPEEWQLPIESSVPTLRIGELESALAAVEPGDAILWLGRPDVGARWLGAIREVVPEISFWLANQAGLPIFAAHRDDRAEALWLLWTDLQYNQWSQSDVAAIQPNDAVRYQSYRATCAALDTLSGKQSSATSAWGLQSKPVEQP